RVVSQTYAPWPITGGGSSPAPTPAPAASNPIMSIDTPGQNATLRQPFGLAGWAVDAGAATGSGVDAVHVWAYPASGAPPVWVGAATIGGFRPDVGAYVGASRFASSGFGLTVAGLPPGAYRIVAFAHSSVTGTFNDTRTVAVTIAGVAPLMSVDAPRNNAI